MAQEEQITPCCGYNWRAGHSSAGSGADGLLHRKGCHNVGTRVAIDMKTPDAVSKLYGQIASNRADTPRQVTLFYEALDKLTELARAGAAKDTE